jgi:hypothetical protein
VAESIDTGSEKQKSRRQNPGYEKDHREEFTGKDQSHLTSALTSGTVMGAAHLRLDISTG